MDNQKEVKKRRTLSLKEKIALKEQAIHEHQKELEELRKQEKEIAKKWKEVFCKEVGNMILNNVPMQYPLMTSKTEVDANLYRVQHLIKIALKEEAQKSG